MIINQLNDLFSYMEEVGMEKHVSSDTTTYRFLDGEGQGEVVVIGDVDKWYYLNTDYSLNSPFTMEYNLTEPYINLGIVDSFESYYLYKNAHKKRVVPSGPRFYMNKSPGVIGKLFGPANTHQSSRSIVIREKAYREFLSPALSRHVKNDDEFYELIEYAGNRCISFIPKAIIDFHTTRYTNVSLVHFLDSIVLDFFAEILHYIELKNKGVIDTVARDYDRDAIAKAIATIDDDLKSPPDVATLAKNVALNRQKLQDGFKSATGMTVNKYIKARRMNLAVELLKSDSLIKEVAEAVGYTSASRFTEAFEEQFDIKPSVFRKRLRGSVPQEGE